MKVKDFFDNEFKQFSIADCIRSIPSVVDGFKPSQRKCIFGMIKRGENAGEIKVAQVSGYISQVSDYHHGEASLNETIVGLAQNYTGSNNINYFKPNGQFGSRLSSESSAPRYIFTEFTDNFRKIFKKEDDIILNHLDSDGQSIEPDYYLPILPNILINGARGMGTGYATHILKYNPIELKENILALLSGKEPQQLMPWYNGFKGTISMNGDQVLNIGVYEIVNSTTIRVTELPIGIYQDDYKAHCIKLQELGLIKDVDDRSTESSFDYIFNVPRTTTQLPHDAILTKFKLIGKDTQNLTAWTEDGFIKVFKQVQDIIDYFVAFRLEKYEERRIKLLEILNEELVWLSEKRRFINWYIENSKLFSSKSKKELEQLLTENNFNHINDLLDIRLYHLTKDDIFKLDKNIERIEKDIQALEKTNCIKMYKKELAELEI